MGYRELSRMKIVEVVRYPSSPVARAIGTHLVRVHTRKSTPGVDGELAGARASRFTSG